MPNLPCPSRTAVPVAARAGVAPRGAVLPLVCVLLTVLIGAAALAIDMGRLYTTATEVQGVADAAALAAGSGSQFTPSTAAQNDPARAQQLAALNRAAGHAGAVATGDVMPEFYDPVAGTTTASSFSGTVNAVRVTARAGAVYALAGAVGLAPPAVSRASTAWIANVNGASCVRPFAPPYTRIYEDANGLTSHPYSTNNTYAPDFTQAQVAALAPSPANGLSTHTFVLLPPWQQSAHWDSAGEPNSGAWHTVDYNSAGYSAYTTYIGAPVGSTTCAAAAAQVGTYLHPFSWSINDTTALLNAAKPGFVVLCNRAGTGTDATCRNADNSVGVSTRVALSDSIPNPKKGPFSQEVRMVTLVRVMCYFQSISDVCRSAQITVGSSTTTWQMPAATPGGPSVISGYPAGTVVVLLDGVAFAALGPDVVLGNTISLSQRLLLVH